MAKELKNVTITISVDLTASPAVPLAVNSMTAVQDGELAASSLDTVSATGDFLTALNTVCVEAKAAANTRWGL